MIKAYLVNRKCPVQQETFTGYLKTSENLCFSLYPTPRRMKCPQLRAENLFQP